MMTHSGRGFLSQLVFAVAAAIATAILHPSIGLLVGYTNAMFLLAGALGLAYSLWIIGSRRAGLMSTAVLWVTMATLVWLFGMPFSAWAVGLTVMIWITRCIYVHRTLVGGAIDSILSALALGAAAWAAMQTGNLAWTTWTFFLVSSLSALISHIEPGRSSDKPAPSAPVKPATDGFDRAYRSAGEAMERLSRQAGESW